MAAWSKALEEEMEPNLLCVSGIFIEKKVMRKKNVDMKREQKNEMISKERAF